MKLEGVWYNQIGEKMDLEVEGSTIAGTYTNPFIPGTFPVVGHADPAPTGEVRVLAYAIRFINEKRNFHFVTGQSGQLLDLDGEEEIVVQWLVTFEAPDFPSGLLGWGMAKYPWTYCTTVGEDVFKRREPTEEEIKDALSSHRLPRPPGQGNAVRRFLSYCGYKLIEFILRLFKKRTPPKTLNGTWYNQVGEKLELSADGASVKGSFESPTLPGVYQVFGHIDPKPYSSTEVFSYTTMFVNDQYNSHMGMSSSGQLVFLEDSEALVVEWVQTTEGEIAGGDWQQRTLKGTDVFRREAPSAKEVAVNRHRCPREQTYRARALEQS